MNKVLLSLAFGMLFACAQARGSIFVAPADQDAWIDQGSPGENHGSDSELRVRDKPADAFRALFRFDLSEIPPASVILRAEARIFVKDVDATGNALRVYRVTAPWNENTVSWSSASASYDPGTIHGEFFPIAAGEVSIDLTGLVRDWVSGTQANHGVVFIATSVDEESRYVSREGGGTGQAPELFVETAGTYRVASGTYAGTGTPRSISALGFRPDVVLLRADGAELPVIRTATMPGDLAKPLGKNDPVLPDLITSLHEEGFTVGTHPRVNGVAHSYHWVAFAADPSALIVDSYTGTGQDDRVVQTAFEPGYLVVMSQAAESAMQRYATQAYDKSIPFESSGEKTDRIQDFVPEGFEVGKHHSVNKDIDRFHFVAWRASAICANGAYPGDGNDDRDILDAGFQPKLVVLSQAGNGAPSIGRFPSMTGDVSVPMDDSDTTFSNGIQALLPSGFQVGQDNRVNGSGDGYFWVALRGPMESPPVIHGITLLDASGSPAASMAPLDTFFVDVLVSDADGFKDVTAASFDFSFEGHDTDTDAPAYRATFGWTRDSSPHWTLRDPLGSTWEILPDLCSVDTTGNGTGPETVRLALVPGVIAREGLAAWRITVTAAGEESGSGSIKALDGLDMLPRLEILSLESSAAFASADPGIDDVPLQTPDEHLHLTFISNTNVHVIAVADDFTGVIDTTRTISVGGTNALSWSLVPGSSGFMDTSLVKLASNIPAPESETSETRELFLWLDHPEVLPQTYEGSLELGLVAVATGETTLQAVALEATVLGEPNPGTGVAEVLPDSVQAGTAAALFTAYLLPVFGPENTGIDRIVVDVPAGYGTPDVTAARINGSPVPFVDQSAPGLAAAAIQKLAPSSSQRIEIDFLASAPVLADPVGKNFVVRFDDSLFPGGPEVATEGNADGVANRNDWKVTVHPGPIAALAIHPDSAQAFVDSTVAFSATGADAFGNAVTPHPIWSVGGGVGTINPSGVFTATSAGTGTVTAVDGAASDVATVRVFNGGITLSASQDGATVNPGDASVAILSLSVSSGYPDARILQVLRIDNATTGAGSQANLDAELGSPSLYRDDGDGVFEAAADTLLSVKTMTGGKVVFTPLGLSVPGGGSVRLFVAADVPLTARDGDVLDVAVQGSSSVTFLNPVFYNNPWPQAPSGSFPVDGMVAAQIDLAELPDRTAVKGAQNVPVLGVLVPPNGYTIDALNRIRVANLGTATAGADIEALSFWEDGENGVFDAGTVDDVYLGSVAGSVSTWTLSGLSRTIGLSGLRLFVSADIAHGATTGRTVRLSLTTLPQLAFLVASGNDGPIDAAVSDTGTLTIAPDPDAVMSVSAAQNGSTLNPGGGSLEVFRLALENRTALPETLFALELDNASTGPGSVAELDGSWSGLSLLASPQSTLEGWATGPVEAEISGGTIRFENLYEILNPGESVEFIVTGGASLAARDGDTLDLRIPGPQSLIFTRNVALQEAWPLDPAGSFAVDGMTAAQIKVHSVSVNLAQAGASRVLSLDVTVPANGYASDALQRLRLGTLGTAVAGSDIEKVEVWRDGGDGNFDAGSGDDALLGSPAWTGAVWDLPGLSVPLAGPGARIFVSTDVRPTATLGRTIRFYFPVAPQGLLVASGNDGPIDAQVAAPASIVIVSDPNAVIQVSADAEASATLRPGGAVVPVFTLNLANETAFAETLTALTLLNGTSGPGETADLDGEWGPLSLRLGSVLLGTVSFSNGGAALTGLSVPIPVAGSLVLTASAGASVASRDGDVLDVRMSGPENLAFSRTVPVQGAWPMNPAGSFPVDGMTVVQVAVQSLEEDTAFVGWTDVHALDVVVPANGYEPDRLEEVRLVQLGSSEPADLDAVRLWSGGLNGAFDAGNGDDAAIGSAIWSGAFWVATGLDVYVPPDGLRLHASVDVSPSAIPGRTIELALAGPPTVALEMAGGNDGFLDEGVAISGSLTIAASPEALILVTADPQSGTTLLPGGDGSEVLRLSFENRTAFAETLVAFRLENVSSGPGGTADMDGSWQELTLSGPFGDLALSAFGGGQAVFTAFSVAIPSHASVELSVKGGASLAARDGDLLDVKVSGTGSLGFSRPVPLQAAWPIDPAGSFPVNGMTLAQIAVHPVPDKEVPAGAARELALDITIPMNGYAPDVLNAVRLENQGDAIPGSDVASLELWQDGGAGGFDAGDGDDTALGNAVWTGARWELADLSLPVPSSGLRLFASVSAAPLATAGRTIRLVIPAAPGDGILMESGNDGPVDDAAKSPSLLTLVRDPESMFTIGASQISRVVHPGGPPEEVFRVMFANRTAVAETLVALSLVNVTTGPGSSDDLDAAWSPLSLSVVGPSQAEAADLAAFAIVSDGTAAFSGLNLVLPPGSRTELEVRGGASLRARDSDDLDLMAAADGFAFSRPMDPVADWPLDPEGALVVDGMSAAQVGLSPVPGGTVVAGESRRLALDWIVPANGYAADFLFQIRLLNLGDALPQEDVENIEIWRDGGDGLFSPRGDDKRLGIATWNGAAWILTSLAEPVNPTGLRLFASASFALSASEGRTLRLSIPSSPNDGLLMSSSNDGPVDASVANPEPLTVAGSSASVLQVETRPQTVRALLPGGDPVEVFRFRITSYGAEPETLTGFTLENATEGPGTPDQLDAEWSSLLLDAAGAPGLQEAAEAAEMVEGSASFAGTSIVIPAARTVEVAVQGGASLLAREGDSLDLRLAGPVDLAFSRPVIVNGSWPLEPEGAFSVDGMAAAQITVHAVPSASLRSGSRRNLALDVTVPANGYQADVLHRFNVINIGSAVPLADLERMELWSDDGDGSFNPVHDTLLGGLHDTGDRWEKTGLSVAVQPAGSRTFVTVDIAELAEEGRVLRLAIPGWPDLGVGMASGNDGPLDRQVSNPHSQTITSVDRVTFTAVAMDSGSTHPGDRDLAILHLEVNNAYGDPRTLTRLALTNTTLGDGDREDLDGEADLLTLFSDDGDGALDAGTDTVLGKVSFSGGAAVFSGLDWTLDSGEQRTLFLAADVSLRGAADGDILSAALAASVDAEFADPIAKPTAVVADWPLDPRAGWKVDGLRAEQVTRFDTRQTTLGPGDGPIVAFDVLIPPNGYRDDALNGFALVNLGTAGASDVSEIRLWRDSGDGRFDPGDVDLGPLTPIGGRWQSPFLNEPLNGEGGRFFATLTVSGSPADSASVRLALPVGGIAVASANDGPRDLQIANRQTLLFSSAPLLASLEWDSPSSTLGQEVTLTLRVENRSEEGIAGIAPTEIDAWGDGDMTLLSGPAPETIDLLPSESATFSWTFVSAGKGTVELGASVEGSGAVSGLERRSIQARSSPHRVFNRAETLDLFPIASMPPAVNVGQTQIVPLSFTFDNPAGDSGSDVLITGIRLQLEDGTGRGIVPADLLTRIAVREGGILYLAKSDLETQGSEVDLTLASPVRVTIAEPVTVNLLLDVSADAVEPSFRVTLLEAAWLEAEDATSGAPVTVVLDDGAFPVRSQVARLVAPATELQVAASEPATLRVSGGARDVRLLDLTLENPGIPGVSSDLRVSAFSMSLTDTAGVPVEDAALYLKRVRVETPFQSLGSLVPRGGDGSRVDFVLLPPLTLPVNLPLAMSVIGDLADDPALGAVRLSLLAAEDFHSRDATTGNEIPAIYEVTPTLGNSVILERPATLLRAEGEPRFPGVLTVGERNVVAIEGRFEHPDPAGTARIRLDALVLHLRDQGRNPLVPAELLDRITMLWNGDPVSSATDLPATGSAVTLPLPGLYLEPQTSASFAVVVDLEASAPNSFLEIAVAQAGIVAMDANRDVPLPVAALPGSELPLLSGLARLEPPARELLAGLASRLPVVLAADGGEVAAGILTLRNPAPESSGLIKIDGLVLDAARRDFSSLPLGAAASRVAVYRDGTPIAEASIDGGDVTADLTWTPSIVLGPQEAVDLELRVSLLAEAAAPDLRFGLTESGIKVVQPGSALLAIAVRPEEGASFPLWTEAGSFTEATLSGSYANFPNPFAAGREETAFVYYLPRSADVTLRIWTPRGENVATLVDAVPRDAGLHQEDRWDGRNGRGIRVVNGVYLAEIVVHFEDGQTERLLRKVGVAR